MFRKDSDLMPRTYTIKGYSKKGPGLWKVLKKFIYSVTVLSILALIILFIIYTV